ncbi:kinase-like domain-containing protein [Haematococcus lacustris]
MVHKEHKGGPPKLVKSATFHGITYAQAVEDNYALLEQIGQGAFGVVRKAVDKTTGALVCCKTIPRALLTANPEVIDDIKQEAKIMLHLRGHPNVVEVYGMFEDEDNIHIVQELCSGGDLKSKLTKAVVPPTEREASAIMHSILQVLEYCHSRQVLYRDVKPDNFLLSTNGPDAVLKATDFGISKILEGDETVSDDCGTPTYMSPEMHKSKYSGSDSKYGFPADIWAAGVTLYFVLSGVFPFKGKSYGELYQSICQTEPDLDSGGWDQVSAEAKDCIRLMLTKDPAKRPTATALLAHKWFKQASKHTKPLGNMVLNRMRAFAAMNNFKKEVIWLISLNLSEEYLGGLSSMFRAMDKDGDGFLSCAEVCEALERRGAHVDKKEVQEIISKINGNRNGSLDIFEFISAAMNQALLEKKDLLRHAFDDFDLDKDGAIGKKEAAAMLRKLGRLSPPAVDQTLAAIKFDAEGKLGFPEFCTLMSGTAEFQGVRNGLLHRVRTAVTEPGGILSTQQRVPDTVPNIQRPGEVRNTNLYTTFAL